MKTALLIRNAFLDTPSFREIESDMLAAAPQHGFRFLPRTNQDFVSPQSLEGLPPACLFWDKDVRLARLLELAGMRLYNPAQSIAHCDDKTLTYLALKGKLPMPLTLLCPMTYEGLGYQQMDFLQSAADTLGLPFIIKEGYGSYGSQVYLVHTISQARELLQRIGAKPVLFQQFIQESAGRDLRIFVVGGQTIAAMKRINTAGDFRANIAEGGYGEAYSLSAEEARLAIDACQLMGLDFAGVDLLFSKDGPLLCEVNSNAHFAALKEVTGINPALAIAAHIGASL